ncbi:hypothetical protein [Nannocystis sp. SCPEA4]|uniref:hypothetical protein n=1 Tax=Nannocystis sp. SCPEA4 TaxID=2996787 RepID=UPI00226FB0E4|nr:hypothetical protein [Nannocystis sp. SCPEA4]MCY1055417.1 hypothetical protein [Nannocystis sp. SCPEA4]
MTTGSESLSILSTLTTDEILTRARDWGLKHGDAIGSDPTLHPDIRRGGYDWLDCPEQLWCDGIELDPDEDDIDPDTAYAAEEVARRAARNIGEALARPPHQPATIPTPQTIIAAKNICTIMDQPAVVVRALIRAGQFEGDEDLNVGAESFAAFLARAGHTNPIPYVFELQDPNEPAKETHDQVLLAFDKSGVLRALRSYQDRAEASDRLDQLRITEPALTWEWYPMD